MSSPRGRLSAGMFTAAGLVVPAGEEPRERRGPRGSEGAFPTSRIVSDKEITKEWSGSEEKN